MTAAPARSERRQSLGEEIANAVSHGVGLVAALTATPFLLAQASRRGGTLAVGGAGVFAASMALLYLGSTLYHSLPHGTAKRVFRVIEHSAIYVLIAGTYTPFTLGALRGPWGWTILGIVWGLAVVGVLQEAIGRLRRPVLGMALYLGMGWLMIVAIRPMWLHMPAAGLLWLLAGGIAYTAGVAFYASKRLRYGHFVWHLFVLAGTTCHFVAVWRYAG